MLYRVQRLRIHSPQSRQLVGIDTIILPLATFRPIHHPRIGHQHFVSATADHFLHPRGVCSHLENHSSCIQCLEEFGKVLLLRTQLSLRQRLPPLDSECSSCSIGPPDPHPPSDDRDWGEAHLAYAFLRRSLLRAFSDPAFPSVFPPVPPARPSYPVGLGLAASLASMSVHSSFQNCYACSRSISLSVVIAP